MDKLTLITDILTYRNKSKNSIESVTFLCNLMFDLNIPKVFILEIKRGLLS